MPNITSFEILEEEIEKINGKPTVLEALWDGDTNGWFLVMRLYYSIGHLLWKEVKTEYLGTVTFGGDIRLFTGDVPAWPEAELAKEMGAKAAEKYGLTFYFPSDKDPDDACPPWPKRHLAISCADCGKLIMPTDSPYLPKDICYHCHLERERNVKLKNDQPSDEGVNMFQYKDGIFKNVGYCTHFKDFEIAPYLDNMVEKLNVESKNYIQTVTVAADNIIEIRGLLRQDIETLLLDYKPSNFSGEKRRFGSFKKVIFDDKDYELEVRFNHVHQKISGLIDSYNSAGEAIEAGWIYKFIFKSGITYRDDSVLRFVWFVSKGKTNKTAIVDRYKKTLITTEVSKTLSKLETAGLITIDGDSVEITETGKLIL